MSLQSQIDTLRRITHELLNLGFEGTPLFSNEFCKLNTEVYRQSECLFHLHGSNAEEEAQLCYVLLTGYHATIYDHGDKNQKIQKLLMTLSSTFLHQKFKKNLAKRVLISWQVKQPMRT